MKRGLLLFALATLLLIAVACGGKATPETSSTTAPAAVEPTKAALAAQATPVPAAATSVPATPKPAATAVPATPKPAASSDTGPEADPTLSPDQLEAIAKLDSYRSVTRFSSEGTQTDGSVEKTSLEIASEFNRADDAGHFSMTILDQGKAEPGATPTPQTMEYYQIGKTMYTNLGGDQGWMQIGMEANPFNDPQMDFITKPGAIFSGLDTLKRERPDEKVNGIDSRRYSFDEKALGSLLGQGEATAKGQLWVAKDGGFVTKYILDIQVRNGGASLMAPEMKEGKLRMEFELKDVNQPITIEVPKEATGGAKLAGFGDTPFPTPDGTRTMAASGNFAIFQTDMAPADVQKFYEDTLAKLGWTKDEGSSMATGDTVSLTFTKDSNKLTVLVTKDAQSGKTQIMANAE